MVGSGIQATGLSHDVGVRLLANAPATVFGLGVLIALLGPVSGAHFNPVVTLAAWWTGRSDRDGFSVREVAAYVPAQISGAIGGTVRRRAVRRGRGRSRTGRADLRPPRGRTRTRPGSRPGSRGRPRRPAVVAAMAEVGIDIAAEVPKVLTVDAVHASDVVITMGCGDACPVFPGKRYLDWRLDDPAGRGVAAIRPIRDEVQRRVRTLLTELGAPEPA